MAHLLTGDDLVTVSIKYLLQGVPEDATETQIRAALRQRKYITLWVMLKFLDSTSALVAVRVPRKSKNSDFTITIRCKEVKAVKLSDVEEAEFELVLNSTTMEMFTSVKRLRETVESSITEMMQVENNDLFLGKKGDIKFDLLENTSQKYKVHPFGSRVTGLGLKNSDYDVFIDMGRYYEGGGETKMENSVQRIADLLRRSKKFTIILVIPRARVPILKVKHQSTGIHCDISTTNGIGVENSKMLRNYLSDRRVRFVCTTVKSWVCHLGLSQAAMGPGAFTSYCMLWLTLFALMQDNPPAVTPVVMLKKQYRGSRLFIDGWDCSFCGLTSPKTKNTKNEIELLHYFFNFYSNMSMSDVKNNVICPYMGSMIPIKQFTNTFSLPSEFDNYKKQVRADRFYEMNCNSIVCVQDPIEQGHNIAKAVDDWVLDRFLKLCKTTAEVMESNMIRDLRYLNHSENVK